MMSFCLSKWVKSRIKPVIYIIALYCLIRLTVIMFP